MILRQGDIWWINCDPSMGHEFRGRRPAVIIQARNFPADEGMVTLVLMSSFKGKMHASDIVVEPDKNTNRLLYRTVIKTRYITSYDKRRLIKQFGVLNEDAMIALKKYLMIHSGL